MVKIGVLDLQGGVREHINSLNQLPNVIPLAVKKKQDFLDLDGLILPGGESTTIGKLINIFALKDTILDLAHSSVPIWGTCAGMILLAKKISNTATKHLELMDITVTRNAYGNQLASFKTKKVIHQIREEEIPLVFIRAPHIIEKNNNVQSLLKINDKIVAAEQDNFLATSFHPELTTNTAVHNYFLQKVKAYKSS
ncbi:MAG: pyridoxal 5'-phosphate synthase glutaminase subunit PdxT [Bacillota bacterium]